MLAIAIFGGSLEGRAEILHGPREIADALVDDRSVGIGGRIVRIEADGLAVIVNGAVEIPLVLPNLAAIVPSKCVGRIALDRLVKFGKRTIQITFDVPGSATVVECPGALRIEADRGVEVRDRAVVFARSEPGETAIVVRDGATAAADFAGRDYAIAGSDGFAARSIDATISVVSEARQRGKALYPNQGQREKRTVAYDDPAGQIQIGTVVKD